MLSVMTHHKLYNGKDRCPDLPDAFVEEQIGLAAKNSFLTHFTDARIAHKVPLPRRSFRSATTVLVCHFTGHLTIRREERPSGIFVLNRSTHLPHTQQHYHSPSKAATLQTPPMTQGLPSHKQHSDPHEVCHCVQPHHRAHTAPDCVQASSSMIPVMHKQQKYNLTSVKTSRFQDAVQSCFT